MGVAVCHVPWSCASETLAKCTCRSLPPQAYFHTIVNVLLKTHIYIQIYIGCPSYATRRRMNEHQVRRLI
jgi:hypothetical protein